MLYVEQRVWSVQGAECMRVCSTMSYVEQRVWYVLCRNLLENLCVDPNNAVQ